MMKISDTTRTRWSGWENICLKYLKKRRINKEKKLKEE
jgi:hypothetical protein